MKEGVNRYRILSFQAGVLLYMKIVCAGLLVYIKDISMCQFVCLYKDVRT